MIISRPAWFAVVLVFLCAQLPGRAQSPVTNLWTLQVSRYGGDSSPALATDGTICQGTFDGKLVAVTPQGQIKWTFKAGREIKSSPAVAEDGTIYFGSRDWNCYAVTPAQPDPMMTTFSIRDALFIDRRATCKRVHFRLPPPDPDKQTAGIMAHTNFTRCVPIPAIFGVCISTRGG
ncbi:MAG TPA: PQQ-binding-like beta-propeller repeat protein [Verrucomicrobiae bacterium]|nr:PQQ-binding-like beta-propeller repeat protein [Verrucomicrobiae bacterium]